MAFQPSHACCSVPPVQSAQYNEKGSYTTVNGMKTYVTGPDDAKKAILVMMDVFGFYPQTLQGADILAYGDKEQPYKVFIPDPFDGDFADISWYPTDTEEKQKKVGAFFENQGAPPKTVERVPKLLEELKKGPAKGIDSWGFVGFCWGGKVVTLTIQKNDIFKAAATCHPAMVDPDDAKGVSIPFAMLPSKDEDKTAVEGFEANLKPKHLVEWFPDQGHGWMAARSDLNDAKVKKEYERGYKTLLDFFHETV